jgi:hypothetical protein
VRAGSAGQCRPVGRLEEVALTGAAQGALELGLDFWGSIRLGLSGALLLARLQLVELRSL